jgi:hypothetical protein
LHFGKNVVTRSPQKLKTFSPAIVVSTVAEQVNKMNQDQVVALDHAKYHHYWDFLERSKNIDNKYLAQGLKVKMTKFKQVSEVIYLTQAELSKIITFVYRMNPLAKGKESYWAFDIDNSFVEFDICTEDLMFYMEFIVFLTSFSPPMTFQPLSDDEMWLNGEVSLNEILENVLIDLNDFKSRFTCELEIIEKIDAMKTEISAMITKFDLSQRISEEIKMDLCRSERIYQILVAERMIGLIC